MALVLGNTIYPLSTVISVIGGESIQGATFAIYTLRLPRMLTGLFVGLAFGIAGSTFQNLLRNPLASPDIIGITSGSSIAAVFCILILGLSGPLVSIAAVISGLLVALIIYLLSRSGGFSGGKLILIGIGIQAMIQSAISYLILRSNQNDIPSALRWLSGSLNGVRLSALPGLVSVVLIFSSLIILLGRHLRILELGEQAATSLGVRTDLIRLLLVLSGVFLIAYATAVTGPIAFVSFLSGPIAKKWVGSGLPTEFPAGLIGAILVIGSDLIGQYAFSTRLPVGVITGILGSPYLLYLIIRMNRQGG
jgi:iron complex transport system permease protein